MASGIYNRFKANILNKVVDCEADTIKVALLNDSHSFTATNTKWSDVSANEISGTGYTAGGVDLANKSVTEAATTKFDSDDASWASATFSCYHAVIYDDTIADDELICSLDFGGAQSVVSGTFTIQWASEGIITLA